MVIRNSSPVAIRRVNVKTMQRNKADGPLEDDRCPGQQFSIIPPGIYYLQQVTPKDGDWGWSAPLPVDSSGGKLVAALTAKENPVKVSPVDLIPVASRPEPKVVAFLGFELGGRTWERTETRELRPLGLFARSESTWDFKGSKMRKLAQPVRGVKDYSRYAWKDSGSYTKYALLHLIAQKFIELNSITTKDQFEAQFGAAIKAAVGGAIQRKALNASQLLAAVGANARYADRDRKFVDENHPIVFNGIEYRADYGAGFGVVADHGRKVLKPIIEHFSKDPRYPIRALQTSD